MALIALSDLRQRFYDLMDEGSSQYISVALANSYINNAGSLLQNFIATEDPWRVYNEAILTPTVNVRDLPLPADFRNALKVYAIPNAIAGQPPFYVPLMQFNAMRYQQGQYTWSYNTYPLANPLPRYRIMGQVLRLDPTPTVAPVGYTVALQYVTSWTPLVLDTDTLPALQVPGHEQWIVNQAVIYAKLKEEVNIADIVAMNDSIKQQILRDLQMRDHGGGDLILNVDGCEDGASGQYS